MIIAAAGLMACGGSDSTRPTDVFRGPRVIAGANATDTAGAVLVQALVVEVRDTSGALVPTGTIVRFTSVNRTGNYSPETYLQALTAAQFGTFASSATDAAGRATVIVQLGVQAGTGRVAISVPILGAVDTARYTITPASASRVSLSPADTLLYVGKSFTFRGGVTDQFGNARTDPVTWKVSNAGVTVTGAGALSATATGRYTIIGTAGVGADTSAVSVVPAGRLTGTMADANYQPFVGVLDLDGSHVKFLAPVADGGIGVNPRWMPGGASIVYSTVVNGTQILYIVDTAGVKRPFFPNGIPNVTHQADPRPSQNGQWLFFAAYDDRCTSYAYCLYRSKIDGSQPELLGSDLTSSNALRPAPSPDGSRVAFMLNGTIKVLDVATKAVSSWTALGSNPSWSPDGTEIAFIGGNSLMVIRADGSSTRTINTVGRTYQDGPVTWSSDGKYLVARSSYFGYDMVDVQSGVYLPLQYAQSLFVLSLAP